MVSGGMPQCWTKAMDRKYAPHKSPRARPNLMAGGVALKVCLVSPRLRILRGKMMINDGILELSSGYFT